MLSLPSITLICVENRAPELGLYAINKCLEVAKFHEVVFITDLKKISQTNLDIKLIECPNFQNSNEYSLFILKHLHEYFNTDFCLIIQWDSFIINSTIWQSSFLNYDYIGPSWPHHPTTPVGNGGFSLRSKKLTIATAHSNFCAYHPEDQSICIGNRELLEKEFDIKFAPIEIADKFGIERQQWNSSFGFHGFFNFSKVLNIEELRDYISKMPTKLLGGADTYDLIELLIFDGDQIELARELLAKIKPHTSRRYKLHRRHVKLMLQCSTFFQKILKVNF